MSSFAGSHNILQAFTPAFLLARQAQKKSYQKNAFYGALPQAPQAFEKA
ncbi:MAG: hypothetical protein IKM08_00600 [Clostridia bacterium]|nr:hypothetical protein [Clostridia bacterium]